jgi:chorismate lyase / 3-hydroxybenzoate synthase
LQAHDRFETTLTRTTATTQANADARAPEQGRRPTRIEVRYYAADEAPPDRALLAAVRFGSRAALCNAPLTIDVALQPLNGSPAIEAWLAVGPVHRGQSGRVLYAHDDERLFALIEVNEAELGGVRAAAASVYSEMQRFQQGCEFRHLLRMWNYLDDINDGPGDLERYREFCVGRAQGMAAYAAERFPAATAIGRQTQTGSLQVFWLASRSEGAPVENPRQLSAYRYPRVHGPVSPSFARATIDAGGSVLISGTASIVGHASQHPDDPLAQLEETIRNLDALAAHARAKPAHERQLLKVYVREAAHAGAIERRLRATSAEGDLMILAADVCRRELLLEIEGLR